jgi:hypothetical protein
VPIENTRDWSRQASFPGQIVLLDGLTGTGKTMLMRLIDSYECVSPPRFDYQLEQICIGISENKIDILAGIQMLQLLIDQRQYDAKLSREVNFRPNDLSSIFRSTKRFQYIRRLFGNDLMRNIEELDEGKEHIFFVVHQLLETSLILDKIPNKSVKRVLATRHPYYLFDHWASYADRHGNSPNDFTITLNKTHQVPWFIKENAEKFYLHSAEDKAALAIAELTHRQISYLKGKPDVLVFDFETFVLSPNQYLAKLDDLIGTNTSGISRKLRSQNLPREHINSSTQKAIYRRYRSNLLTNDLSHKEDYRKLRERISHSVSKSHFILLESAAKRYEEEFGLWF